MTTAVIDPFARTILRHRWGGLRAIATLVMFGMTAGCRLRRRYQRLPQPVR